MVRSCIDFSKPRTGSDDSGFRDGPIGWMRAGRAATRNCRTSSVASHFADCGRGMLAGNCAIALEKIFHRNENANFTNTFNNSEIHNAPVGRAFSICRSGSWDEPENYTTSLAGPFMWPKAEAPLRLAGGSAV